MRGILKPPYSTAMPCPILPFSQFLIVYHMDKMKKTFFFSKRQIILCAYRVNSARRKSSVCRDVIVGGPPLRWHPSNHLLDGLLF